MNSSGPSVPEWSWLCGVPGSRTCSASGVTVWSREGGRHGGDQSNKQLHHAVGEERGRRTCREEDREEK